MLVNSSVGDKFFVTLLEMLDVSIILGQTWQRKYNCFLNWNCKLAHWKSANNCLWVPLQQPDASYASTTVSIPKQLDFEETPTRLPKTQIKQSKNYIWWKKNNNSTKSEPTKVTKQPKPEVWKRIPKEQHQEISISEYRWIPKHPTISIMQSPNSVKKPK